MAYENVSVTSARSAINSCLDTLNCSKSEAILSGLDVSTYWNASSRSTFSKAIDLLINTKYSNLKAYLNKCLTNIDNIENYKEVQSDVDSYNDQISRKSAELDNKRYRYYCLSNQDSAEGYRLKSEMNDLSDEIDNLKYYRDECIDNLEEIKKNITF